MSIETTLARGNARAAEERWRDHLRYCPPCSRWKSRHRGQTGCETGRKLHADAKQLAAVLKASREADREPVGMDGLW